MRGSAGAPTGVLEEGEEVGEFLSGDLGVETGGHEGNGAGTLVGDVAARDALFGSGTGDDDEFAVGFGLEDAVDFGAVAGGEEDGFVAADEAGVGVDDAFEEVAFGAGFADAGEVGADLAAEVTDLVTGVTGGLGIHEDSLAATDVGGEGFEFGEQLVEVGGLAGGIGVELEDEVFAGLTDFLGKLLEDGPDEFGSEGRL